MPNQRQVQEWLDTVEIAVDLNTPQLTAVSQLVGGEGLALLLGLMMGARQGLLVQLSGMPLATPEQAARASVIQGQIRGIDMLPQTLLSLFPIAGDEQTA